MGVANAAEAASSCADPEPPAAAEAGSTATPAVPTEEVDHCFAPAAQKEAESQPAEAAVVE